MKAGREGDRERERKRGTRYINNEAINKSIIFKSMLNASKENKVPGWDILQLEIEKMETYSKNLEKYVYYGREDRSLSQTNKELQRKEVLLNI